MNDKHSYVSGLNFRKCSIQGLTFREFNLQAQFTRLTFRKYSFWKHSFREHIQPLIRKDNHISTYLTAYIIKHTEKKEKSLDTCLCRHSCWNKCWNRNCHVDLRQAAAAYRRIAAGSCEMSLCRLDLRGCIRPKAVLDRAFGRKKTCIFKLLPPERIIYDVNRAYNS